MADAVGGEGGQLGGRVTAQSASAGAGVGVGVPVRFFPRAHNGSPVRRPTPAILLFNPWATRTGRVPNSLLHIAAALGDGYDIELVDGNLEPDPWAVIEPLLASGRF
jgi:anaerobic magnesium-protoporphyrin IX monomethyl ester cyclase